MATIRDFVRQLQKLPQDAQLLIEDARNGCLVPPTIQVIDSKTFQVSPPRQADDESTADRLELEHRELEMSADDDAFDEG
jgi:hypothetical protein